MYRLVAMQDVTQLDIVHNRSRLRVDAERFLSASVPSVLISYPGYIFAHFDSFYQSTNPSLNLFSDMLTVFRLFLNSCMYDLGEVLLYSMPTQNRYASMRVRPNKSRHLLCKRGLDH
jgi:hypothetical protein